MSNMLNSNPKEGWVCEYREPCDLNKDQFYRTIWQQEHTTDREVQFYHEQNKKAVTEEALGELELFKSQVDEIEPTKADSFEYISIGQALDLLNESFGQHSYSFVEISRRIDMINRNDYHFIIRMAFLLPKLGICIIREGVESFSNKAFKQGFRGQSVAGAQLEQWLDTSPEGALSLWKNAEADAKKRCLVDMGVGSQFLVDPAENKKHGRKAGKAAQESQGETESDEAPAAPPVVQSEDDIVRRSEAMAALKILMKKKGMKSPQLYPIANRLLKPKEVSKWADLTADDMITVANYLRSTDGESE